MNFARWGIQLSEMRSERWPDAPPKSLLPEETWFRAVTVNAPVETVFRWICQLRAAPYSYDWIDNFGKPSPRRLIDGLDHLEIGQRVMMIFRVDDFLIDRFMTIVPSPAARFLCSDLRITYRCAPIGNTQTRLMVRVQLCYPNHPFRSIVSALLAPGDLLMMRKQLLTLKQRAEGAAEVGGALA
jgi:hypothetical protein